MNNFYEELLKHDLNPYLLFDSNGKIKSYNIEAEFLMNFVTVKELFELAISNASINFGFNKKYISLKYDKLYFYAILVGYVNENEVALRLYKVVSNQEHTISNDTLKIVNIFSLIDLSKNTTLLNSNLKIEELYDISLPEMKININNFLICLNECFLLFIEDEHIALQVQMKTGEYEIINHKKYKIVAIEFTTTKKVDYNKNIEYKAEKANANIFFTHNKLRIEMPIIV
ncbi:MAG: hypothetical protein DRG78_19440 [Epsilonproteobacteria bacterium]|nr:MAG: hypothetical protein DRG78_19440 [Campylobacterota bacterium]